MPHLKSGFAWLLVFASSPAWAAGNDVVLATTTSTRDSGLLDALLPAYEQECSCRIKVVAVGSGKALRMGRDGEADVLLVHSREDEDAFVRDGFASGRLDVMHNDFVLVGPASDPAGLKAKASGKGALALAAIAQTQAKFVSRGDDSGTHRKELALWKAAGLEPKGAWYVSTGRGMSEVVQMADEMKAYTLTDRATFLAMARKGRLDLKILVEKDAELLNPYAVLVVNATRVSRVNTAGARKFAQWLVAPKAQEIIGSFGVATFAEPLFFPRAKKAP